jgi:LysM repeat protein
MTHKVQKGETIIQIAQKYQVTPYDIYQLNPDAQSA